MNRIVLLGAILAVTVSTALPARAQQPRTGEIGGQVVDGTTQQPLANVAVSVEGSSLGTLTREDGRFIIPDVPVGTHTVRTASIGYRPLAQGDVVVTAGRRTAVAMELETAVLELEGLRVTVPEFARPSQVTTTSYGLNYEEIRRSPGALGDVSRLVQSLPGVITSNDQRNDIVARGGSPTENLTLVDNVEVPNLNHFASQNSTGGPISMLNNEFVQDATFLAGGFPAQYGNRLSSVLDIRLREGSRERLQTELDVSLAGAGLIAEGPMGERGSWLASARQSYLALIAGPFGLEAIPSTTNYQFKATFDVDARNKVWLVGIGGRDGIEFEVDPEDLADPSLENIDSRGWRAITGVNWRHLLGSRGYGVLGIADAYSAFNVDVHDTELGNQLTFRNRSREGETTTKYDLVYSFGSTGVKAGASWKGFRNDLAITAPFGSQNPYSPSPEREDPIDIETEFATHTLGGYFQVNQPVGERAEITLGGRIDHFAFIGVSAWSPRAGLLVHLTPALDLQASYGRYHQQPALVYLIAAAINRELAPMRADHYVAGVSYLPVPDVKLTIEAYRKDYSDYPVSTEHPELSLANTGDVFGVSGLLFPMRSEGEGMSQGVEVYLQKKLTDAFYGLMSYSYSRTEHEALDGIRRRGGFDVPHAGSVIAGYKLGTAWEVSSRFSYATGRPYTPAIEDLSIDQNRMVLDLARVNTVRAPEYHRLDVRVDRRFSMAGFNTTIFFEAQNLYNRDNVFQYVWNPKTRRIDQVSQISFLPILGVNMEF